MNRLKFMDLLFSKYASPFSFLDELISNGDFLEWVLSFIDFDNERTVWELWLHKEFEKSFGEFKDSILKKPEEINLETTIKDSQNILNNFVPECR